MEGTTSKKQIIDDIMIFIKDSDEYELSQIYKLIFKQIKRLDEIHYQRKEIIAEIRREFNGLSDSQLKRMADAVKEYLEENVWEPDDTM